MDEEQKKLIDAWLKMYAAFNYDDPEEQGPDYYENFWAFETLCDMTWYEPEKAWPIILAIRSATDNNLILATLAAGHFEDLIQRHGNEFIERIEALAKQDESFRHFIGGAWKHRDMSQDLLDRLRAIALKPYWD